MEVVPLRTSVIARRAMLLVPGIISVLSCAPVFAGTHKLALAQVLEVSVQNNGDLKSFREEKGIRDAGRVRAGTVPNPTLDLETATGALSGSSDENSLSIGISQEFSFAGKAEKRLTVANRELEIYRWQLADRERLLREEVQTAFHDAILAEKRVGLADRAIELNRQLLDVTVERLAAGDIPELEMNLVKVELARSEGSRIAVTQTLHQYRSKLWSLMGLPVGEAAEPDGNSDTGLPVKTSLVDLKQLAHTNRPDLKALVAESRKEDADITLAQAEAIPNLTAGLVYTHERRTDATGTGDTHVRDNLFGIRFSMPIPLFDTNQAGVQEARARKRTTDSRLSSAAGNIDRDVETAHAGYLNSETILSLYTTSIIPQLEENLKLTQEAYRLGEVGILAVIQEQKKFFEVSDGYLMAQHDRQTARVKLESAVATDLTGGAK